MNESGPAWYCIRTLHKHEHIADANLRQLEGVTSFYPRLRASQRLRGKDVTVIEPLFPCYLFARFKLSEQLNRVRYTYGVKRVVSFTNDWPTIPDEEIEQLRAAFGKDSILERPLPDLPAGTEVEIMQGPLRGFKALVTYYMPAAQRVRILVDLLCQKTPAEVDVRDIVVHRPYPDALLA